MGHGPSILEMTNRYEKKAKGFKEMVNDVMTNKAEYYGVLSVADNFDLLVALVPANHTAVWVLFYRGWPKAVIAEGTFKMYLMQSLNMFPEIKTIKFEKGIWPKPYDVCKEEE